LDNYKTIKELADELHVSKHIVKYQVDKIDSKFILKKNNKMYVSLDGQKKVRNSIDIPKNYSIYNEELFGENEEKSDIKGFYNEEIRQKNKQIEELHKLLNTQQTLLDQQQQLTLQSNKQIEQLQKQLLITTTEEKEVEESQQSSHEIIDDKKEKMILKEQDKDVEAEKKKWFQFWK